MVAALVCAAAAFALSAGAKSASAVVWGCDAASAVQYYHGAYDKAWLQVSNSMSATSSQVCAKQITAANNVRTPWKTNACSNNTTYHRTCYSAGPNANAYIYWAGSGTIRHVDGWATSTVICE